ncbi:MAG: sigma-70 family RNA polymerase sigma factor [Cellvibrionaceae bacterium]
MIDKSAQLLLDESYLAELRRQMVKFAHLQLADQGLAEDAVHEALIGALKNSSSFAGASAFKTWVFAILKNKIADVLRKNQRLPEVSESSEGEGEFDHLFNSKGFWYRNERPASWGDPLKAIEDGRFWVVFEACLEDLSPRQARVFMMREFIDLETDEICKTLDLSVSNLHVLLHRARLRLRECLEKKWFVGGAE